MRSSLKIFKSRTGQLNLRVSPWNFFSDYWEWLRPKSDELWLSNGRNNETWASMFDDLRQPYKLLRNLYQFIEINPIDAKNRSMSSGDLAVVYSNRIAVAKDSFLGVKTGDYSFDSMIKNGHIQFKKASFKADISLLNRSKKV